MLIKNLVKKCVVMIFMVLSLVFIPGVLSASHSVMLSGIPEYSEESYIWCGPAVAQMIMHGYPSGSLLVPQEDIWAAIQGCKVETMWDSDPQGLKDAMQHLNPPSPPGHWVVYSNSDAQALMYSVAYWMTRNNFPVAVLLNTTTHNGIASHQEHWVEVRGIVTDITPIGNTTIDLQNIWYTDPSPTNLGDPAVTSFITGSTWYSLFQPVNKTGSSYNGNYVAIIEPPQRRGIAIAPIEILRGEILPIKIILQNAEEWIKECKFCEIEAYKDLKNAIPLKPILVDKKYGGYYLIPYTTTRGKENNLANFALLINAYKGNFQQVGAFEPTQYLSEQAAVEIAINYLKIKGKSSVNTELVTQIEGHTFGRFFPAWKITIDDKVVHVTQRGKVISTYLPGVEHKPKPTYHKKWSASVHGGMTFPITDFGSRYKSSYMFGVDFDYHFTPQLSAVTFVGFNHFRPKPAFSKFGNTHWWNLSANLKWEFSINPLRPYVDGGFGFYIPKTGSAKPGFNVGIGLDRTLNQSLVLEAGVDYHHILMTQEDPEFFTTHIGLILRF